MTQQDERAFARFRDVHTDAVGLNDAMHDLAHYDLVDQRVPDLPG
jgi:hypothetical protein